MLGTPGSEPPGAGGKTTGEAGLGEGWEGAGEVGTETCWKVSGSWMTTGMAAKAGTPEEGGRSDRYWAGNSVSSKTTLRDRYTR